MEAPTHQAELMEVIVFHDAAVMSHSCAMNNFTCMSTQVGPVCHKAKTKI